MRHGIPRSLRIVIIRAMLKLAALLTIIFIAGISYLTWDIYSKEQAKKASIVKAQEAIKEEQDWDKIENGVHVRTGLVEAEGLMTVVSNCTSCHSAKLITQNRMTAERWNETIKWMQKKQGLWELGDNQKIIVDYLVANYPYKKKGRRPQLTDIKWYELED